MYVHFLFAKENPQEAHQQALLSPKTESLKRQPCYKICQEILYIYICPISIWNEACSRSTPALIALATATNSQKAACDYTCYVNGNMYKYCPFGMMNAQETD